MEVETLPLVAGSSVDTVRKHDSLRKRYVVKLAKSLSDVLINVTLLLFVPRVLGPSSYGSFNFIRETFQNVISFADLSLSSAHVNYASRKDVSRVATNVYFSYTLIIGLLVAAFVAGITLAGVDGYLFPGQTSSLLFMGALLAYLMYLQVALMGLSDSKVATVGFEMRSIGVNIVMFVPLMLVFWSGALNLTTFFVLRIALYAVLLAVGARYLFRTIGYGPSLPNMTDTRTRDVIRTFVSYSHPLVTLSILGVLFSYFDRWFLQVIYGSVSQGYYSLAFSLSAIAGLFLGPMTPLLMQSVAKSDEANDLAGVRTAFGRVEFLYLISAFVSVFFMFHTAEIVRLIGGHEYDGAQLTIAVMFLYPIHVVYGQFCGATLLALRKTAMYRNISLFCSIAGVVISYVLLAPRSFTVPGLELNSLGLAVKIVTVQLFAVNLQLYFVCRHLNERMFRFVRSQVLIPLPIVAIGLSEWLLRSRMGFQSSGVVDSIFSVVISLAIWSIALGGLLWHFPVLAGFEKSVMRRLAGEVYLALSNSVRRQTSSWSE